MTYSPPLAIVTGEHNSDLPIEVSAPQVTTGVSLRSSVASALRSPVGGGDHLRSPVAADSSGASTPPNAVHPLLIPFCYAAVSGLIGSQSVMLAKSSSILIFQTIAGINQFKYFFTVC